MILFLDDNPERCKAFKAKVPDATIVKTAEGCIKQLETDTEWSMVFLDHDLGGEMHVDSGREDCGMEVVRWIVENDPFIRRIFVHTHNPPAAVAMSEALRQARYTVDAIPFSNLIMMIEENL